MSSLRDIMDVDMEPLQSQALKRQKNQQLYSQSLHSQSLPSQSLPQQENQLSISRQLHPLKPPLAQHPSLAYKRPRRSPKSPASPRPKSSLKSQRLHSSRESSAEYMGHAPPRISPTGSLSNTTMGRPIMGRDLESSESVRFTPVTGRISRAKKGFPVHTCRHDGCIKTFTRAEHLRRHAQSSHDQAKFHCDYEGCTRVFHRRDLLARHLQRHQTQGALTSKSSDNDRRPPSPFESSSPQAPPQQPMPLATPMGTEAPCMGYSAAPSTPSNEAGMRMEKPYSPYSVNAGGFPSHTGSKEHQRNVSTSSSCAPFSPMAPVSTPPTSASMNPAPMSFSMSGCNSYNQSAYVYNAFSSAMITQQLIVSNNIYTPIPQMNMDHVSGLLQAQTQMCPHTPNTGSPRYHSDNSFSTLSTPSDVSRMPTNLPREPRSRAFSAPSRPQPVFTDHQLYPQQDINAHIEVDFVRQEQFEEWTIENGYYPHEEDVLQGRYMPNEEYWPQDLES